MASPKRWAYPLEQLYEDQDPALVVDSIAQLICWSDPEDSQHTHRFELREHTLAGPIDHELTVSWNVKRLAERDPRLHADIQRFRAGKTLTLEQRTQYAAYGLAMVATSCLLRRRIVRIRCYRAPDLLLDAKADALRGIEVAGRTSRGYAAFAQAVDGASGKRAQLHALGEVVEAYLSLWCREPKVSMWEKVKP